MKIQAGDDGLIRMRSAYIIPDASEGQPDAPRPPQIWYYLPQNIDRTHSANMPGTGAKLMLRVFHCCRLCTDMSLHLLRRGRGTTGSKQKVQMQFRHSVMGVST